MVILRPSSLQKDVRRFLSEVKQRKSEKLNLFKGEGDLTEFLGRGKDKKDIKEVEHETIAANLPSAPSFKTYLKIKEPRSRIRAKEQQHRRRKPQTDEARKRARIRALLKDK